MLNKKVIKHILLIIWCIVIFMFSSETRTNSDSRSRGITDTVVGIYEKVSNEKIDDDKRIEVVDTLNHIIRKGAHFSIYLVLGILSYSCFLEYDFSTRKTIVFSITYCILYAISDEVHQLFISGRGGRLADVFIDSSGSITGTFVYYLLKVLKK